MRSVRVLMLSSALLACGGDHASPLDAGNDTSVLDANSHGCVVDFPCGHPWACVDPTHWVEAQTFDCSHFCSEPCSGAMCVTTGDASNACPPQMGCVDPSSFAASDAGPCAFGGIPDCVPQDESTFIADAGAVAPTRQASACSVTDVQQFWSQCLDPNTSNTNTCADWQLGNAPCGTCLTGTYVVSPLDGVIPNVSGCYAFFDQTTALGSCASRVAAIAQCEAAACQACAGDVDAAFSCVANASSACSAFPACDSDASASYETCEPPVLEDFFVSFGTALCAP